MKDFLEGIFVFAAAIGFIAFIIWLCAAIFGAIWNSDMPMWLKWFLLR